MVARVVVKVRVIWGRFHVVFLSGCIFREVCLISTEVTGFGRQGQRAALFRQSTEKVKIGWVNYRKGRAFNTSFQ